MTRWQMFQEALAEWRQERLERAAFRQTLSAFARIHPVWHESLFDGPFLRRFAPAILLTMEPEELALEWSRQFSYRDAGRRARDVKRVTEAAEHFQSLLAEQIARLEAQRAERRESRAGRRRTVIGRAPQPARRKVAARL